MVDAHEVEAEADTTASHTPRKAADDSSPRASRAVPLTRDPVFLGLVAAALLQAIWVGSSLWVADLNLHYPFPGGDGHDWIANALALRGEPVRYTGRPPLFALLLAALQRASGDGWLPLFQQLAVGAVAAIVYTSLRRRHARFVAATVALCVLANETLLRQSLEIMAEPLAAALLAGACAAFLVARERPRLYLLAGALGGLAILAQPATGLFLPAAAITMAMRRRSDLRRPEPWLGAALLLAMAGSWLALESWWMGQSGEHGPRALSLIRFHLEALAYYANAARVLAGWPLLLLIALGIGQRTLRVVAKASQSLARSTPDRSSQVAGRTNLSSDDTLLFTGLLAGGLLAFFLWFYDFRAERFLVYPLVAGSWWAAEGLAAVRIGALRAAAAALALVLAAWPAPSLEAHPWVDVARFAREEHRFETIDPELFDDTPSIVFLERPDGRPEGRWRPIYRLGNALHRRVKVVPASLYPREWWGWSCLGGSLEADEYVLVHWSCPGAPTSAVLAWSRSLQPPIARRELALRSLERAAAVAASGADSAVFPASEAPAWDRARQIAAELDAPDGFLVAYATRGEKNEWVRALPFVADTSSLVVTPRRGPGSDLGRTLARGPTLGEAEVAGCHLRRTRERGYEVLEIVGCADD